MKKTVIYVIMTSVICFFTSHLLAQDLSPKENKTTGKWGFVDKQGKVVIPYKYAIAGEFSDGLAMVAIDKKAGYINKLGKIVIPLQYDGVGSFNNGFATVMIDSKWGVIDKTGKEIIPCLYQHIQSLEGSDGFSVALDDKLGFFDKTGKQIIPFEYDRLAIIKDGGGFVGFYKGMWVKIDKDGNRMQ